MKRTNSWLFSTGASAVAALAMAACGSRTGLELEPYPSESAETPADGSSGDAHPGPPDAAGIPDGAAYPESGPPDASPPIDAADDDAADTADAVADDAAVFCPDGGVSTAYIWGESGNVYTFDPSTFTAQNLGVVSCPTAATPWTLSVSRTGFGYFMFEDWLIYRVDLTTLACEATPYQAGQLGFTGQESIAISRDPATEQLYVYGMTSTMVPTLAVSDLTDFTLASVGAVTPNPDSFPLDMQADAFGHLFALSPDGLVLELDAQTAGVLARNATAFTSSSSWAIMTWNQELFLFGGSQVNLYDPSTNQVTLVADLADQIVGASAAACVHGRVGTP